MTTKQAEKYRDRLLELAARIRGDIASLEEEVDAVSASDHAVEAGDAVPPGA